MATKRATKTGISDELYEMQEAPAKVKTNGATEAEAPVVEVVKHVPRPDIRDCYIDLVGTSSLICHNWSKKAKEAMLNKQMRKADPGKEPKNPELDFIESLYSLGEGRYGFPALAFKKSMVRGGTYVGQKMTVLRGAFHVIGEFVEINGVPRPREDMVRIDKGTADIRYRGEFPEWTVRLHIRYNRRVISEEQLLNLALHAGFSVGVGDWRPERDGASGMFDVLSVNVTEASLG
jgi:hypothetical protein